MPFQKTELKDLKLKRATARDVDLLFNWINDPEVRAQSLSSHTITLEEHTNWFNKKLTDGNCYLYIAYYNDQPAGMIRFDRHADECIISYLVDSLQRGKGLGHAIINYGIKQFANDSRFKGWLKASVKKTNIASVIIFERSGFGKENAGSDIIAFKKFFSESN